MNYRNIKPPFTLKFNEMSKVELKQYNEWFHSVKAERVSHLVSTVKATAGYENWVANYLPDSLNTLGNWFSLNAEKRKRTEEELNAIENRLTFSIDIPEDELTNKTFSLAFDIAFYFSELFLTQHPTLYWEQVTGNKRDNNFGQPVLAGFKGSPLNPVWIMFVLAYGLVDNSRDGSSLGKIYDVWESKIVD